LKKLEITINKERSDDLEKYLDGEKIAYVKYNAKSIGVTLFVYVIFLPDSFVDEYVDNITRIIDLRLKNEKIIIFDIEAYVSTELERMTRKSGATKTPIESLFEQVEPYSRLNSDFFSIVILATLIIVAGLFLNDIIIIIGAMLISPLLEPIKAFNLNLTIGKYSEAWKSEQDIILLLFSIITVSAFLTYIVNISYSLAATEQIVLNGTVSGIIAIISLIIGMASGLAMFSNIPGSLIGITVAIALMPPASSAGIGLALSNFDIFYGAVINLISNLAGLQLGGIVSLKIKGVSQRRYRDRENKEGWITNFVILIHIILLSLIFILGF
jgi:uncharacterized hydrophobic protein (TIGR00341 family)